MTVLIVDDDEMNSRMLSAYLSSERYSTLCAANEAEAWAMLETEPAIKLVLMEIESAGGGFELAAKIRATPGLAMLPIAFVTRITEPESVKKAASFHCAAYLLKPVQRETLLKRVGAIIGFPKPQEAPAREVRRPSVAPIAPSLMASATLFSQGLVTTSHRWIKPDISKPTNVALAGRAGRMFDQALGRLKEPPLVGIWRDPKEWFEVSRPFDTFKCEMAGRLLRLTALKERLGDLAGQMPDIGMLAAEYQQSDGHFGEEIDGSTNERMAASGRVLFWGNARLLAGLVTACKALQSARLQAVARRLGNFYCDTADKIIERLPSLDLLSPRHEPNFSLCYFAAMEGLALLSAQTGDPCYLQLGERMAARFIHFDPLPAPLSQASLVACLGVLELHEATDRPDYLARVESRWDHITSNGCVWATGAIGRQLSSQSPNDDACSESLWLQLNLKLWHCSGKSRYLSMAQRIVRDALAANQLPSGGFGFRGVETDTQGAVAVFRDGEEKPCCSAEVALGLDRARALALAGSESGLCFNFPVELSGTVEVDGQDWDCQLREIERAPGDARRFGLGIRPHLAQEPGAELSLYIRQPDWANDVAILDAEGAAVSLTRGSDQWIVAKVPAQEAQFQMAFAGGLRVEDRRFNPARIPPEAKRLPHVVLRDGPDVLYVANSAFRPTIVVLINPQGRISLPQDKLGRYVTATVQDINYDEAQLARTIETGQPLFLCTWAAAPDTKRKVFVFDLLLIPAGSRINQALRSATERINGLL